MGLIMYQSICIVGVGLLGAELGNSMMAAFHFGQHGKIRLNGMPFTQVLQNRGIGLIFSIGYIRKKSIVGLTHG